MDEKEKPGWQGKARRGAELLNIKFKKEDIYESFIM
jgi:hypothetical protein